MEKHTFNSLPRKLTIFSQDLGVNMCEEETKKKKMERTWIKNGHLFVHMNSIQMFVYKQWRLPIRCNAKKESQTKMMPFFMNDEALCQRTNRKRGKKMN